MDFFAGTWDPILDGQMEVSCEGKWGVPALMILLSQRQIHLMSLKKKKQKKQNNTVMMVVGLIFLSYMFF